VDPLTISMLAGQAAEHGPAALEAVKDAGTTPIYSHTFGDGSELRFTPAGILAITGGVALVVMAYTTYMLGQAAADWLSDGIMPGFRSIDDVAGNVAAAASKATGFNVSKGDVYQAVAVGATGGLALPFVGLWQAYKRWGPDDPPVDDRPPKTGTETPTAPAGQRWELHATATTRSGLDEQYWIDAGYQVDVVYERGAKPHEWFLFVLY